MPLAILFWVLMLLRLLFCYVNRVPNPNYYWGGALLDFLLFATLGWKVFGAAIQ
jgi:hypothetical protein